MQAIKESVGPNKANKPDDVAIVVQLLNRVPSVYGGPSSPLKATDLDSVFAAIYEFQDDHRIRKGRTPWGFVGPTGKTMRLLNRFAHTNERGPLSLRQTVGPRRTNHAADVETVRILLNDTSPRYGGPPEDIAVGDLKGVIAAIAEFQKEQKIINSKGRPYGYVGPTGRTLPRLNQVTGRGIDKMYRLGARITLPISKSLRYVQGGSEWQDWKMNNSSKSIWGKGCAVAAAATAFAAKGITITDTASVEEGLRKKCKDSKKVDRLKAKGLGTVTPLTLDAWMTAKGSQGYVSTQSISISWTKVAKISPNLTYLGSQKYSLPIVRQFLDSGYIVIARLPGHFVVITGHNEGSILFAWDVGYYNLRGCAVAAYPCNPHNPVDSGNRSRDYRKTGSYQQYEYAQFSGFRVFR